MAQGRQRVGEAGAIGSPKLQESKAKEMKKRRRRTVVYGRVYIAPYGSHVAYGPSVTHMPAAHG